MFKFLKKIIKRQKGFTLIELLVVIAILGILAAVAIPNVTKFIGQSKIAAANTELGLVKTAIGAGMADQQTSTMTAGTESSSSDLAVGSSTVGAYIQGGNAALKGSYTISASGQITAATYTGGGTFNAGTQQFS